MTCAHEVVEAAARIVEGDDSGTAASGLESAILTFHPYEEGLEDLLEALAMFAPSLGSPYLNHVQLCDAIRRSAVVGEGAESSS